MEINLKESSCQRARQVTLSAFHTLRFWFFQLGAFAGLTTWVLLWIPPFIHDGWRIVYQILVPLMGVFAGLAIVFLISLFIAPYKQRNEARHIVSELDATPELFEIKWMHDSVSMLIAKDGQGKWVVGSDFVTATLISIKNISDVIDVQQLTIVPGIRFFEGRNYRSTSAISFRPHLFEQDLEMPPDIVSTVGLEWVIKSPFLWEMSGLPLTLANGQSLMLPRIYFLIGDITEIGKHFDAGEGCAFAVRLTIRTNRGSQEIPELLLELKPSGMNNIQWLLDMKKKAKGD